MPLNHKTARGARSTLPAPVDLDGTLANHPGRALRSDRQREAGHRHRPCVARAGIGIAKHRRKPSKCLAGMCKYMCSSDGRRRRDFSVCRMVMCLKTLPSAIEGSDGRRPRRKVKSNTCQRHCDICMTGGRMNTCVRYCFYESDIISPIMKPQSHLHLRNEIDVFMMSL